MIYNFFFNIKISLNQYLQKMWCYNGGGSITQEWQLVTQGERSIKKIVSSNSWMTYLIGSKTEPIKCYIQQ